MANTSIENEITTQDRNHTHAGTGDCNFLLSVFKAMRGFLKFPFSERPITTTEHLSNV